ncbi:MAG: hypothetical protein COA73_05295 [Candidatus Hydrogenedentota bacterium]|nr:MAG: hypothetical protein COA73_05295 [Candidatus Hydrogenedentota bacterium]
MKLCLKIFTITLLSLFAVPAAGDDTVSAAPHAQTLGWDLGVQAFSFYTETFAEAVDRVASLNLKYIEVMPFGRLSPEHKNIATNHNMPAEYRKLMREKLQSVGVVLSSYGVVPLPNDEEECRKVFEFAKEMGCKTIVSEPPPEALDLIERLCDEYEINVAIHNHPTPSAYWNPQTVKDAVQGRSNRLGACADTSHWMRSGLDVCRCRSILNSRAMPFSTFSMMRM